MVPAEFFHSYRQGGDIKAAPKQKLLFLMARCLILYLQKKKKRIQSNNTILQKKGLVLEKKNQNKKYKSSHNL